MLTLETAPTNLPFDLEDLKRQLRIDGEDDDAYINQIAHAAVAYIDGRGALGRAMITQTWAQWVQNPGTVRVEMTPFRSLSSVQYYDAAGVLQTATVGDFEAIGAGDKVYIRPKDGFTWPNSEDRPDAIKLTYVAGYGDTAASVPETIRHALALLVTHWYEHREPVDRMGQELPYAVEALLNVERIRWYG